MPHLQLVYGLHGCAARAARRAVRLFFQRVVVRARARVCVCMSGHSQSIVGQATRVAKTGQSRQTERDTRRGLFWKGRRRHCGEAPAQQHQCRAPPPNQNTRCPRPLLLSAAQTLRHIKMRVCVCVCVCVCACVLERQHIIRKQKRTPEDIGGGPFMKGCNRGGIVCGVSWLQQTAAVSAALRVLSRSAARAAADAGRLARGLRRRRAGR